MEDVAKVFKLAVEKVDADFWSPRLSEALTQLSEKHRGFEWEVSISSSDDYSFLRILLCAEMLKEEKIIEKCMEYFPKSVPVLVEVGESCTSMAESNVVAKEFKLEMAEEGDILFWHGLLCNALTTLKASDIGDFDWKGEIYSSGLRLLIYSEMLKEEKIFEKCMKHLPKSCPKLIEINGEYADEVQVVDKTGLDSWTATKYRDYERDAEHVSPTVLLSPAYLLTTRELYDHGLLDTRAINCLKAADIECVAELVIFEKNDLLKFRNFGKKTFRCLDDIMVTLNISWGCKVAGYHPIKLVKLREKHAKEISELIKSLGNK